MVPQRGRKKPAMGKIIKVIVPGGPFWVAVGRLCRCRSSLLTGIGHQSPRASDDVSQRPPTAALPGRHARFPIVVVTGCLLCRAADSSDTFSSFGDLAPRPLSPRCGFSHPRRRGRRPSEAGGCVRGSSSGANSARVANLGSADDRAHMPQWPGGADAAAGRVITPTYTITSQPGRGSALVRVNWRGRARGPIAVCRTHSHPLVTVGRSGRLPYLSAGRWCH